MGDDDESLTTRKHEVVAMPINARLEPEGECLLSGSVSWRYMSGKQGADEVDRTTKPADAWLRGREKAAITGR